MSDIGGLFLGLALTIFGALLQIGLGAALLDFSENAALVFFFGCGVLQMLYVIPVYRGANRKHYSGLKIGLAIGASLIFLIASACGLLLWEFSRTNVH